MWSPTALLKTQLWLVICVYFLYILNFFISIFSPILYVCWNFSALPGDSVFAMTLIKSEEIISFKLQARGSLFWERSWNAQLLLGTFKRLFCIHRMVKRGEKAKKKKKSDAHRE